MAVALYLRHIELVSAAKAIDEAGLLGRVAHCDVATQTMLTQIRTFLCTDAADIKTIQTFGETNDFPPISIARKVKYALPRMKQTAPSAKLLYRWLCAAVKFMDAVVPIGEYHQQKMSPPTPSPRTAANANAWIFENWEDILGEKRKPEELPRYLLQNGVLQPKPYLHLRTSAPRVIRTESESPTRQPTNVESDVHLQGKSSRIAQHESAIRMMRRPTPPKSSMAGQVQQSQAAPQPDRPPTRQPIAAAKKARAKGTALFPPRMAPRPPPSRRLTSFGTQPRNHGLTSPLSIPRPPLHSPRGAIAHALVSAGALTRAVPSRAPPAPKPPEAPRDTHVVSAGDLKRDVPTGATPATKPPQAPRDAYVVSTGAFTRAVPSRAPPAPKPPQAPRDTHVVPAPVATPKPYPHDKSTHVQVTHSNATAPKRFLPERGCSMPDLHAVNSSHPIFDTLWHDQTPSPPTSQIPSPSPSPRMESAEWRTACTPSGTRSSSAGGADPLFSDGAFRAPPNHTAQIAKLTQQAKQFAIEMNIAERELRADHTLSAVDRELITEKVQSLLRRQQMIQREVKRLEMENY